MYKHTLSPSFSIKKKKPRRSFSAENFLSKPQDRMEMTLTIVIHIPTGPHSPQSSLSQTRKNHKNTRIRLRAKGISPLQPPPPPRPHIPSSPFRHVSIQKKILRSPRFRFFASKISQPNQDVPVYTHIVETQRLTPILNPAERCQYIHTA